MTGPGTANPRWREKPCSECGKIDWMFGRRHRCADCRSHRTISPEARRKAGAHRLVQVAIQYGFLTRQPCQACISGGRIQNGPSQGHHEDYSKPLDVVWLCALHHRWVHQHGLAYVMSDEEAA